MILSSKSYFEGVGLSFSSVPSADDSTKNVAICLQKETAAFYLIEENGPLGLRIEISSNFERNDLRQIEDLEGRIG